MEATVYVSINYKAKFVNTRMDLHFMISVTCRNWKASPSKLYIQTPAVFWLIARMTIPSSFRCSKATSTTVSFNSKAVSSSTLNVNGLIAAMVTFSDKQLWESLKKKNQMVKIKTIHQYVSTVWYFGRLSMVKTNRRSRLCNNRTLSP